FLCFQDRNYALLQSLLEAHAKTDPTDPELLRSRYRLEIRQGRVAEGVALFKAALAKHAGEERRRDLVSDFLFDMVDAGKPLEGYRAAPDAKEAFQMLAEDLLEQADPKGLRQLIEAHRARHPDDTWLALYTGELHVRDGAWDKAAQAFREGLQQAPE